MTYDSDIAAIDNDDGITRLSLLSASEVKYIYFIL